MASITQLLIEAIRKGSSDLHITVGVPPVVRIDGFLEPLEYPPLRREDTQKLVYEILNDQQKLKFETEWELDFSTEIKDAGRFRVNVHLQRGCVEAAFRIVQDEIRTIKQLGLPPIVGDFARRMNGLILITGPTGSGKTTTLAALVNQINFERRCMIIIIEDPIEYTHRHKKSIIKQREVTSDTKSFGTALRHVLRQDPDVICIGEMRDLETISTALTAAETGHLVFSTLHTPDVIQTVDRVIDVFPPHQQQQVRIQLANTLEGVVSQQLIAVPGGRGRVAAAEVLVVNVAVRKVIRSSKTEQLMTLMQTNYELGMLTMDKSLKNLYQQGLISYDDAITRCKYPEAFDTL
ncbi:type IV pilus twitching motility protein PilT [Candidatus Sumerlaeota bacterium]|nr:type IV pilus twitching motility protein PilT [Candidatus Sumerlaeota bacterium]